MQNQSPFFYLMITAAFGLFGFLSIRDFFSKIIISESEIIDKGVFGTKRILLNKVRHIRLVRSTRTTPVFIPEYELRDKSFFEELSASYCIYIADSIMYHADSLEKINHIKMEFSEEALAYFKNHPDLSKHLKL